MNYRSALATCWKLMFAFSEFKKSTSKKSMTTCIALIVVGVTMSSRSLRRLIRLSDAAVIKTGDERALILKTILKILDECSDADYDVATTGETREKLIAAGIDFVA
jgi:hypothetical protein